MGSLNVCCIDCRDIFKHAILNNAAFIMSLHNHPTGNPEPREEDRKITARMEECGRMLGIPMIDHIIFGEDSLYYSFKEQGRIKYSDEEVA